MSKDADGHSPETCNYNYCGGSNPQTCPFLKDVRPNVPDTYKGYKPPCKHEWRQYWDAGRLASPYPNGFYCIHCKKVT